MPEYINPFYDGKHKERWKKLAKTIETYKTVGRRNIYLYDWLLYLHENLCVPCVDKELYDSLCVTKTKIAILDVLIDDIADSRDESEEYLNELLKFAFESDTIRFNKLSSLQKKYLDACLLIWQDILSTIEKYPRYAEFKEVFDFDVYQILNSMRFAHLANTHPEFNNMVETTTYGHHSMTYIVCAMLDLMCSKTFDINEFRNFREVIYHAQQLFRIGNIINTYPREVEEKEISSDILTLAIQNNVITFQDITRMEPAEILTKVKGLEKYLKDYWSELYEKITQLTIPIKSLDRALYLKEARFIQKIYEERVQYWKSEFGNALFVK